MVNTAVILAAGMGTRLKGLLADRPKGFIQIDNKGLIEHSIQKLIKAGIKNIIIGTGYSSGYYEGLEKKYKEVRCVKNELYETTGSMFTLLCAEGQIRDDFLLLESDLLYDYSGLEILIYDIHPDVILASGMTSSGDEVFIEVDSVGNLLNLSKNRDDIKHIYGELVGLSKISLPLFQRLVEYCGKNKEYARKEHYENCLRGMGGPIFVKKEEDLPWCEIDSAEHLRRAEKVVYPKIREREKL